MNAYFPSKQTKSLLWVIAQDQSAVDLLHNQTPEYSTDVMAGPPVVFKFKRSEKTITLLRLLGVYGELK